MKNIKMAGKKRVAAFALAGAIGISSLGTATFAYKDAWTAKINQGIQLVAGQVFKEDIQAELVSYGNAKEAAFKNFLTALAAEATAKLTAYKNAEIARGKAEIDSHDANNRARITEATDNALNSAKNAQKAKDDAAISKEQGDLDKIVDDNLDTLPK